MPKKNKIDIATDLWKENNCEDALKLLRQCEEEQKNNEEDLAEVYMYEAWVLKDMERFEEAKDYFDKALTLSTDSFVTADSLNGKGMCLSEEKRYGEAIDSFKRAVEIFETIKKYHKDGFWACASTLIHTMLLAGKLNEAIEVKEKMAKNKPPKWVMASVLEDFGHYFYRKELYDKSIPYYEQGLKFVGSIKEKGDIDKKKLGSILCY